MLGQPREGHGASGSIFDPPDHVEEVDPALSLEAPEPPDPLEVLLDLARELEDVRLPGEPRAVTLQYATAPTLPSSPD